MTFATIIPFPVFVTLAVIAIAAIAAWPIDRDGDNA